MPLTSLQPPASSPSPQPLILALVLSLRLRTVFPAIRQSATLLVQWCRAQIGLQRTWQTEAETLAAELDAQRDTISAALRNDPPEHRRKIEAALDAIHRHQVAHAAHLAPHAPAHLLKD